ncbi:MAG: GDSL family lipase [Planctomycetota bacterium]|nr:MAG: GDSL family lipase [Planctomycetota bacterium]
MPHSTPPRILFQGDSITDCKRDHSQDLGSDPDQMGLCLGRGYAMMIGAQLTFQYGIEAPQLRNLGLSGNRIVDLAARAQEHIWNLGPSLLSILIGINETWHLFQRHAGVDIQRFIRTYDLLLSDTRERLPDVEFIIGEPFALPCGVVEDRWFDDLRPRQAAIAELAAKHQARLIPYQRHFDEACKRAPAAHWAPDGVHPSPAGHWLMAQAWLEIAGPLVSKP